MQELFDHSLSVINIVPTILLVFSLIYWLIVLLGAIDIEFLDIDVDVDTDVDVDIDTDIDVDTDADVDSGHMDVSWINSVLIFFNLGQVPLMIFLTFLAIPFWYFNLLVTGTLEVQKVWLGMLLMIPTFLVSAFIAKFATTPFVRLFEKMRKDGPDSQSLCGKICRVILVATETHNGQAEIKSDGTSFLINTRAASGQTILKGENALVIEYDKDSNFYYIEPYNSN